MKKVLLTTIALAGLFVSADCYANSKKGYIALNDKCEEKCNAQGKRVDVQYSEEEGECKCSTGARTV